MKIRRNDEITAVQNYLSSDNKQNCDLYCEKIVQNMTKKSEETKPPIIIKPLINKEEKKIIYFLHFHKAGGSSICKTAKNNHQVLNYETNCNVFIEAPNKNNPNDKSWLAENKIRYNNNHRQFKALNEPKITTCCGNTIQNQLDFARITDYTFVANEKYMPDEVDYTKYSYMTVFREPWSRYESHYIFARDRYYCKQFKLNIDVPEPDNFNNPADFAVAFNKRQKDIQECEEKFMGSFEDWLVGQPDNYMFRSLCGNACMEIDRGKLTKEHMDEVKKRLDNFDIIMTLENFDQSMKLLEKHPNFKWTLPTDDKLLHANSWRAAGESVLTPLIKAKYYSLLAFDIEIYEYARYLNYKMLEDYGIDNDQNRINYAEEYSKKCEGKGACCADQCSNY